MLELYGALDAGLNILSGIGIRTAFDIASEALGVDPDKTFANKLEALVVAGFIRENEKERIGILIEVGHGAAHRKWSPSDQDIDTAMDVLEVFLNENFIMPYKKKESAKRVQKMKEKIPPKELRHKKPSV